MALNETKLKPETAFETTRLSGTSSIRFGLSNQSVRRLPNCYPVVADHVRAMRAIVPRMQLHLIPSRLLGQLPQSGTSHCFFALVYDSAAEHGRLLSDSGL